MNKLKFIGLSGTTGVTENLYVYEYGDEMIIVDCGVGFPDSDMFGIDLVIPDFSYIKKNKHKLKAIVITHGHEDHIGALPFLLKDISAPIYCTELVSEFIKDKFEDHAIENYSLKVFSPEKDILTIGSFKITPFRVAHSIPDGVGFCIETPVGKVFHVADYKFDWTPVVGHPFDITKAAVLASDGVLLLVSDSLGSMSPGFTESEAAIEGQIDSIARNVKGKLFFTTISSNISRIQQALNVAERNGRKVAFIGYSIDRKARIAKNLGLITYKKNLVVSPKKLRSLPYNERMYIIAGGYGQMGSSLYRVAMDEHKQVDVQKGDVVIFSSDPAPPGTKESVDVLVDKLFELGVEVHYYDTQEDLHVSGHGSQEDIKTLFGIVRPKYYIPVGGTVRHNRGYKKIAVSMGASEDDVIELSPGEVVEFEDGKAQRAGKVSARTVLVDGLGVGDVGNAVLRDRQVLSQDGIVFVHLQIDKENKKLQTKPDLISRGFVFEKVSKDLLNQAAQSLETKINSKQSVDKRMAQAISSEFLDNFFFKKTGRRPMILPFAIEM